MRTLALDFLFEELGDRQNQPDNLEDWYENLREHEPERLFSYLVEDVGNIEKIYMLYPDKKDLEMVILDSEDMTEDKSFKLPFKQFRARAIGPVIKRSKTKDKISPTSTTQKQTLDFFKKAGESTRSWAGYFKDISAILARPKIKLHDETVISTGEGEKWNNIYSAALELIPSEKGTVMVAIADINHKWPGERSDYLAYLMEELTTLKYCTGETPAQENQTCPLCGTTDITVFPNALKGAGINLLNPDRVGAFPGIDVSQAWKGYALCGACADLLFIYKEYVLKKDSNKRNPFITNIAGDNAVVIPFVTVDFTERQNMLRNVKDFVKNASTDVEEDEESILEALKEEKGILNLTFLWATVGQWIENVTGMITNVPPTRLAELSKINEQSSKWKHPLFPERFLKNKETNFAPDLSIRALNILFKRPGGKKSERANQSVTLRQLKRNVAVSIYHGAEISEYRFWQEIITTARWYWLDAIENGSEYGLLHEGQKKTGEPFLTAAGWIRHLCWWLNYLKKLEVMRMGNKFYEPQLEKLKPYFGTESGIDSPEKAYSFLLGVLYGKVLQVQGAKGVNVGANALTWLKRLTLKGRDLPMLYIKIREKLLAYETEKSKEVRDLVTEIGSLGWKLGDSINLDEIPTNYFLLLGQSLTTTILPKKEES